jgi:2-oxoglutarate ferredoxin oxidoreductase subunit delta
VGTAEKEVFFFLHRIAFNKDRCNRKITVPKECCDIPGKKIVIEEAWCRGCGICTAFCPGQVLEIRQDKVFLADEKQCIACGLCEQRCP